MRSCDSEPGSYPSYPTDLRYHVEGEENPDESWKQLENNFRYTSRADDASHGFASVFRVPREYKFA